MHQALYRKWRPKTFDDVCGQEHITSILKYEAEKGNFNHAYLFCGSRGTGKTTCAKILAKIANCENPKGGNPCGECAACRAIDAGIATDVLEMDAASNNGVDNIRDIREEVEYPPSLLKYRVYIVDEVHMLSDSAFNALLKTLEEPPSYVIFILATTELHELPATIVSRCQRFEFRRISLDVLTSRLSYIAEQEGIQIEKGALQIIAKQAQGGMRDAISLLELCTGGRTDKVIDEATVNEIIGISSYESLCRVAGAIAKKDLQVIFEEIDSIVRSSKDIGVFWQDLMSFYRDMLVVKTAENADKYLDLTDTEARMLGQTASLFTRETLFAHCKLLEGALFAIQKSGAIKRIVAEMTLVKMCDESLDTSSEGILSRLSKLENAIAVGAFSAPSTPIEAKPQKTEKKAPEPIAEPKTVAPAKAEPKNESIWKYVSAWVEAIERVGESDSASAGFLKLSKAYMNESGDVKILFADSFTMGFVNKPNIKNEVRAALSYCLGREIPEQALTFEVASSALPEDEADLVLDELLKNFE